jgi:phosphatidylinositol-3-phosphatase
VTRLTALAGKAVAAAASLTGKKFALMVASSLVATTGIVAAAMTGGKDLGPLAALVGRSLASGEQAAPTAAAEPAESAAEPAGGSSLPASGGGAASSGPLPAPAPSESSAAPTKTEDPQTTPEEPEAEPGPIQHVFVISLASSGYESAFGATTQMPYLASTLRPQGLLLSRYSLLDAAALPNSLAAVSGQPPNTVTREDCPTWKEFPATAAVSSSGVVAGSGCVYPVTTLSVADQMASERLSWRGYMEGMADPETGQPGNCVHAEPDATETPVAGGYSSRLNPFAYFHSLLDLGDCATNDVPLTELEKDLRKADTTPNYSYVSPDLCDAGVAGQCAAGAPDGAASADAFLSTWAGKILSSPAFKKDGLLIVTFGLANPPATDPATGAPVATESPLKTGALLVSRFVSPGSTDATAYDPYTLLKTVEDLFHLDHLARARADKVKSLAPALLGENGGD